MAGRCGLRAVLSVAVATALLALVSPTTTTAQITTSLLDENSGAPTQPMLMEADELVYDFDSETVVAEGNVQIYYDVYKLRANRVTYHRATSRVVAQGNVQLTEPDGNVIYSEKIDVTDTFSEGFVEALRVETPDNTYFAAQSAERQSGNQTVFHKGVYTACEPCEDNPSKPPLWQVKAQRIIHNQKKKMVYYKNARIEFFGVPLAYTPYLSHPDPTVKRKTGFLAPYYRHSTNLGYGFGIPFFWAIAPNYDITFSPTYYTRQGLLGMAEWRHRLINGSYSIRAAGILQQEPSAFAGTVGNVDSRGAINTTGEFKINDWWNWGWDATIMTDKLFMQHYRPWSVETNEIISTIYLTGRNERNYFDARLYEFRTQIDDRTLVTTAQGLGTTVVDIQDKQPLIHPSVDYSYIFGAPVFGGELGFDANLTSLSRDTADNQRVNGVDVYRGLSGSYTRASLDVHWQRALVDRYGQVFTPFAYARGDLYWLSIDATQILPGTYDPARDYAFRGMPAVGLEYSWPFVNVQSWGTQVIEPIAQVIVRPDELDAGELPNEDSQSLVFDDSTLFDTDKFSGFDRVEGGGRANVGISYTVNLANGGSLSAMVGQSFHLFGKNPYKQADLANAAADSGLDSDNSDYVARVYFSPNRFVTIGTRARFDDKSFVVNRFESAAAYSSRRLSASTTFAYFRNQPALGILSNRSEVTGAVAYEFIENWSVNAGFRYDIDNKAMISDSVGLIYDDECFTLALTYAETRDRYSSVRNDQTVTLQFNLRTLGDGHLSTSALGMTQDSQ
ncbi:MAG: LPS-assembly protein LptD [Hyphomicrobiales bacterium]|nr:LPS-assembly protein LptD [Hyphomicrobiales bacterium]